MKAYIFNSLRGNTLKDFEIQFWNPDLNRVFVDIRGLSVEKGFPEFWQFYKWVESSG